MICGLKGVKEHFEDALLLSAVGEYTREELIENLSLNVDLTVDNSALRSISDLGHIDKETINKFVDEYAEAVTDNIIAYENIEDGIEHKVVTLDGVEYKIPLEFYDYLPLEDSDIPSIIDNIRQYPPFIKGAKKLLIDVVNNNLTNKINYKVNEAPEIVHTPVSQEVSTDDNSDINDSIIKEDEPSIEYLKDLHTSARHKSKQGIVSDEDFSVIYFADNTDMHVNKFKPHVANIFSEAIFRLSSDSLQDAVSTPNAAIASVLMNIIKEEGLQPAEKITRYSLQKTIIEGLYPKIVKLFSEKELSEFNSADRNLYFNYLIAKELHSIIANDVSFISVTSKVDEKLDKTGTKVIKRRMFNYEFNKSLENARTNYDDAKNGSKNSKFIRAQIESFKRVIPISERYITEEHLLSIIGVSEEDIRMYKRGDESTYDTVKRLVGADYIIDPDEKFLGYNHYQAICTKPEYVAIRDNRDAVMSYLKTSDQIEAVSLYLAMYSDSKTVYFDPDSVTKNNPSGLKSFNSFKSIVDNNNVRVVNDGEKYFFKGNFKTSNTRKVFTAIETSMRSMDTRSMVAKDGSVWKVGNLDIKRMTDTTLMQQVETELENGDVSLSERLKGKVFVSLGLESERENVTKEKTETQRQYENNIFINIDTEEGVVSIPLMTNFNNSGFHKEQPSPDGTNSVVAVARTIQTPDEIFKGVENNNPVIKEKQGKAVLKALGFPEEMLSTVVKALNSYATAKSVNVVNKHDFTNFVANYAMMIALNDDSVVINNNLLDRLGILDKGSDKPNSIRQLSNPTGKISSLRYDIYTYLQPYTLSLYKNAEERKGIKSGTVNMGGSKKVTVTSPSNNHNLGKIKKEYVNGRFKENDFIVGNLNVRETPIKKGVYNPNTNSNDDQKSMGFGRKTKQLVEANFLGAINKSANNKVQVANVQLTANESTLIMNYNIDKGQGYEFIPLNINESNGSFTLNKDKLSKELIDKQQKYYNAIIDTAHQQYNKAFEVFNDGEINSLEVSIILDKFSMFYPELNRFEAYDKLQGFYKELKAIEKDSFYMHNLNKLLGKYKFNVRFFNMLPEIYNGVYYTKGKGGIATVNTQLLYDIDLWNDQMAQSNKLFDMGYNDYYTPYDYINYVNTSFLNTINSEENKTHLAGTTIEYFNNITGLDVDPTRKNKQKVKDIVYLAYHYQEMMLNVDLGPILFDDVYKFMKNPSTVKSGDNLRQVNYFFLNKLENDGAAYQAAYKRAKPVTQTGGDNNTIPYKLRVFTFEDPERKVNTLGDTQIKSFETYDGLYFRFPFAAYMHDRFSSGKDYGYNPLSNVVKDILVTRDGVTGEVTMDKRAAHNVFGNEVLDFNKENYEKDYNDKVTFRKDGKEVSVVVPAIKQELVTENIDGVDVTKYVVSVDYEGEPTILKAKTINDIFRYLGGNLNPNLYKDTADIMMLDINNSSDDAENNIMGKYADGLSFLSSRKMGAAIINPVETFNNKQAKVYPIEVEASGLRFILDGTEDPMENHTVAIASQMLSAMYSGTETDANATEIFNALGSITELSMVKIDQDILYKLYDMIAKGRTDMLPIANKLSLNDNAFKKLVELSKEDDLKPLVKDLWHAYAVEIMQEDIVKKSQDIDLQAMLEDGGDINGQLNTLFISIINTHMSSPLNVKLDGMNNLATQMSGIRKVYGEQGVSKRMFMDKSNEDNRLRSMTSKEQQEFNKADIIFVDNAEMLQELGLDAQNTKELKSLEDIKTHKKLNQAIAPNSAKAYVTDVNLAVYADFAATTNKENISTINKQKDEHFLEKITILDAETDINLKVNKLIEALVNNGDIARVCK